MPGSSLSVTESKCLTGTLCGYVRHGSDVFALTNHHVVIDDPDDPDSDPSTNASHDPYRYVGGQRQKLFVSSPSAADRIATIAELEYSVSKAESYVTSTKLETPFGDTGKMQEAEFELSRLKNLLHQASKHNGHLGFIIATSGLAAPARESDPRLDWALIQCDMASGREFKNTVSLYDSYFFCMKPNSGH